VEEAEIIFLNDFRWTERILPWQDLLRLLEGDKIHIPTPKTHFAQDVILEKDTPIFCTGPSRIRKFSRAGDVNEIESQMMEIRWKIRPVQGVSLIWYWNRLIIRHIKVHILSSNYFDNCCVHINIVGKTIVLVM
jgi:hypothetical protein